MSEYIDGRNLLSRQGINTKIIRDFELLDFIRDGLQPYDRSGIPINIKKVNKMFEGYLEKLGLLKKYPKNYELSVQETPNSTQEDVEVLATPSKKYEFR